MALKLNIVIASTRPGRVGPSIAKWVNEVAIGFGQFDVELVDLADFNLPLLDEPAHPSMKKYEHDHTRRWSDSAAAADAFIFVTPEYDYFPPASLVNALQYLFHEWAHKPAGVVSYGGISGGLRSTQILRGLLGNLNMVALNQSVPMPFARKAIGEDGVYRPDEPMKGTAEVMLTELHRWATALKTMRAPK